MSALLLRPTKNLQKEVAAGNFREDLYYRLNVIGIDLPPLRERPEDIEPLIKHFLQKIANRSQRSVTGISPDALQALKAYRWPGNVRELENVMERCSILARGGLVTADYLPFKPDDDNQSPEQILSFNLRDTERLQVIRALRQTRWNKSRAAELLGVTRKTIDRKIKEFDLDPAELLDS